MSKKTKILLSVCVVLSTVCISCARSERSKTQNSSSEALTLVDTLESVSQIEQTLGSGMTASVEHSAGL